MAPQSHKGN
jgi:hypothetical protein